MQVKDENSTFFCTFVSLSILMSNLSAEQQDGN